jgi:DNA-binding NarL/FixJ family response regulator
VARAANDWKLTPRQTEVLGCILAGDANKTIAERLGCALGTVEVHVSALLTKACVESRTALVARVLAT